MRIKQLMGIIITLLGMFCLLLAGYVFVWGESRIFDTVINRWEALVPFIIGLIFFGSGISLVKRV